jgi:hypothetical protein
LGIINGGVDIIDEMLIEFFCICHAREKVWVQLNGNSTSTTYKFPEAFDSVRREVLYNMLIEFWVSMKPVKLTKCVYMKPMVKCICKCLANTFLTQNGLKEGGAILPLLLSFSLELSLGMYK